MLNQGGELVINTNCSISVISPGYEAVHKYIVINQGVALEHPSLHVVAISLTVAESGKGLQASAK
jgi:hypothetical protein